MQTGTSSSSSPRPPVARFSRCPPAVTFRARAGPFSPVLDQMAHRPSGVPQLDRVLGGGITAGDLVLVAGSAGSGKTTLALQMAFDAAARQETVCFVSTTSESPKRLLEHARSYGFYDEAQVGTRLLLLNVFPLVQEGLQPVQEALE